MVPIHRRQRLFHSAALAFIALTAFFVSLTAQAEDKKPNIVVIMGDDIGWFNIGAYHQGMMAGRTPNLDKLANEGMRFTDYYAEAIGESLFLRKLLWASLPNKRQKLRDR
jgi:hypothetical protein